MKPIYNCMLLLLPKLAEIRAKHEKVLIIVSVGNYYLSIADDTKIINDVLEIDIVEYSGQKITCFDYNMLDEYLPKLVRAGNKVAMYHPV